jgi:hypothetical protein
LVLRCTYKTCKESKRNLLSQILPQNRSTADGILVISHIIPPTTIISIELSVSINEIREKGIDTTADIGTAAATFKLVKVAPEVMVNLAK